jgi:hypothetical protein
LEASGAYAPEEDDEDDIDDEEMMLYEAIKEKQTIARNKSHETKVSICTYAPIDVCMQVRTM